MDNFIFDLQRFAVVVSNGRVIFSARDTYELDGVTYTALEDATLRLNSKNKVEKITSGRIQATATGATNSPTVTFDATDDAIDFSASGVGSVLTVTTLFPIEFISGEFTYKGNTLNIGTGATLAIIDQKGDISLRNENTFEYGGTYTFSDTAMTSESQHTIGTYTLSNGTETRTLNLESFGTVINRFNERGFTLVEGSSEVMHIGDYTLTATALNQDAGLNISLGSDGITLVPNSNDGSLNVSLERGETEIISGELECTSGSITFGFDHAITFAKDTSFTFDRNGYTLTVNTTDKATTAVELTGDGKIKFTPGKNDGGLNLSLKQGNTTLFDGELNVTNGTITFDANLQKFSFTEGTNISISLEDGARQIDFTVVNADASFKVEADGKGNFTLTPDTGDGSLDITIKQGDKTIFANNISVTGGSITIGNMGQTIGLTQGASATITLGNYTLDVTATDEASFGLGVLNDGTIAITPQEGGGALDIAIKRGDDTIFSNTISVSGGTITFNPTTQLMTLTDGTTVSLSFNTYEVTATADGNASSTISFTGDGITVTPQKGDGTLNLTLTGTSSGSLSATIEVLSGSFTLGDGGALTVTAGTELQIKFSDDYIINFKATNEAGGTITLGSDEITFAPNSSDGGLELSVTKDGETRSASLDVTGSVTYKLDGSISLAKGTVVKNVFDDGNILTIEAKTAASGSITFNPQNGLTIEPKTTNALEVTLTTDGVEVVKVTSITGSITYQNGIITATDGTKAHISYYFGWESELRTTGGSSSVQFTTDRTVYIAGDGANFVIDYLDGTTAEIQNGIYSDIYATETTDAIELISVGSTFRTNDDEQIITLEKAGDYTLNGMDVTTSEDGVEVQMTDYDTIVLGDISFSSTDKNFVLELGDNTASFKGSTADVTFAGMNRALTFDTTDGEFSFDNSTKKISIAAGTSTSHFRAANNIFATYKVEEDIYYFELDNDAILTADSYNLTATLGGVISYNPSTGTYGLTGANSSHGNGSNSSLEITNDSGYSLKLASNDTTVVFIPTFSDGKFEVNFPNDNKHEMLFTWSKDGQTTFEGQVSIGGTITYEADGKELTLAKDTVLTLIGDGKNNLEITALNDAGGQLTFTDEGIKFAPNSGDGQLELNFVATDRKANIDVSSGAIIFGMGGNLSLEKNTVVNLTWEDGNALTLTATDNGGSIGFDAQGLKVSSDGELSIDLTTASGVQTTLTDLNGTIHYNAGKVLFDADSKITATSTLGGQSTYLTLESKGAGGYAEISANGTKYAAGDGALKVTWARDDKESTFSINSGSVFIGHGIFEIAQGSDLSTDLKDLVPALYFTTTDAGNYTINNQIITTTAEDIPMTATDDYMTFKTSDDPVIYDGMNFAGNGNVSLISGGVVLGAGVEATGFGVDKSFILSEAGSVTADARIFELTEDVPTGLTVTGAQDGFIFSRTTTEESESRFDKPNPDDVGKIFTEQFFLDNDDAYRIQTDLLGLQKIIGVTAPVTVNADANLDGQPEETIFDVVTDNEGVFTVSDKNYSISGSSSVAIKTIFNDTLQGVRGFDSLSGTVAGDFTEHEVSINGSASAVQPVDDTNISIAADENGFEISGLDNSALLSVSATDSYVVNNTTINANAGDYIAGNGENSAYLLAMNNNTVVTGTDADDFIGNHGTNVTINALGGNDTIMNYGASDVTINGGADNDIILNAARVDAEGGEVVKSLDNVVINGGAGNDIISNEGSNVTMNGGADNDIILNEGSNVSINGGAGTNQISLTGASEVIVLKGRTTVEGFNMGFGEGTDTIYIESENDPAGVEFLDDGLTFGNDTASLTLSDVTGTAKVNLFHENRDMLNKGVFIGQGEWYTVEESDLTVEAGEEVYFVGTAATPKAGVDFSGISGDVNVTMDTAYIDSEEYVEGTPFWVNGVYSLKGGAGLTTITGSNLDDTIISGSGETTINARGGDDLISLSRSAALVNYAEGDGNDTIVGFDSTTTLSIGDNIYSAQKSGSDLIVSVGDSKITLVDAAKLDSPNIESTNGLVQIVEAIEKRTAAGYPVIAGLVFNPEEITGPEPTNYAAKEDWTITSADDLELYGVHYTPENSNDKWVVLVHGYGCMYESMNPFATFYLANNYNVLMIDQRAAGKSEGTWLTMGVAESQDVALWTQEIANRYPDSKITLHGVSMGAATAILTAARSDVVNVTSIVEDCGYSDVMKTFETIVADHPELAVLGISAEVIPLIDPVAESLTGYYLHDAAPIDSIASVKQPTLFISGDDDGVAPVSMLHELYDESGAEVKEKFIVKGAGHARAGLNDPVGYSNTVFRFLAEANGEGWETENIFDDISLRGTKYNDTLTNSGEGVTMDSGEGDDYISNTADNVSIAGGEGSDTIYNHADKITIDGGLGDDSISNNSDNVVFIWSGGNDTIDGFKEDSVLQIDGDYSSQTSGSDVIVTVGDKKITLTDAADLDTVQIIGTDPTVISNSANDTLITGTGGDDSIDNAGDRVTIKAYGGDDTINNTGEYAVIEGSDGADSITNYSPTDSLVANGVSINAGAGNDTIRNHHAYYVTLDGGSGDDHISVVIGNQTKIDGGTGNDTILGESLDGGESTWAMGGYATIDGGDGDDYINPIFSDSASILGGDGNDTIINEGDDATLNGGAGDDVISLHGASLNNDVIKYDVGDGNDSIFGFNETSQLSITAGTQYETLVRGVQYTPGERVEDVLVMVGDNVLTIAGGASLSTINIVNYEVPALNVTNTANDTLITGTELADTIKNTGANVSVSGRASNDSITSSGANGSLDGGAGNDTIRNSGANSTVEGYYGDDYLINTADNVLISGNYGNDVIENSGDNVTVSPGSGSNLIVNSGQDVVINFTGGADSVWGFNETSKLNIASGATSVRSDGNIVVTLGEDKITLVDAASVVAPNFDNGESIILTEKGAYSIDGKVFELIKDVPTGVTLTGERNGFTSGITDSDGIIGVEEFIVTGDDSYNVSISGRGIETVSGINAGANVSTSGIKDGATVNNKIYVVTENAGSYTFNDIQISAANSGTEIFIADGGITFAADGITYDGKTFAGAGNVSVNSAAISLGANVSATGFGNNEFILAQRGTTSVDGRTFELTEKISDGMTIESANNEYTFSHKITQKEVTQNNLPSSYAGKIDSENVVVEGDETYSLRADTFGLRRVRGISDGATILGGDMSVDGNGDDKYAKNGQYFYVDTDTEGSFTIGEKSYSISGDSNVEIVAEFLREKSYASGFASLEGTVSGDFAGDEIYVNGSKKPILVEGDEDFYVVGSSSGTKLFGVSGNATLASLGGVKEVHTDTEGEFWIGGAEPVPFGVTVTGDDNVTFGFDYKGELMSVDNLEGDIEFSKGTGGALSINGIGIKTKGTKFSTIGAYDNSLYIHDVKGGTITAYEPDKVWLQMLGETMTLNGNRLTLTNDADGVWLRDKEIVGLDDGASLKVSTGGNYLANETSLKARSGDVIIGLENDAYIYDAKNPLFTRNTSNAEIINHFKPKNSTVVSGAADIALSGGDLAIVENISEQVNITAGDDTIVSQGENVHVSLTPEKNTWLFPLEGKMTLEGHDEATGTGFGTTYTNILSAVEDGRIDFNNGTLTLGSAQIDMGTNSALMNFFNRYGKQQKVGYASQGDSLDASGKTDDLVLVAKENGSITGGSGDDTILASAGSYVDGGAGKNLVKSNGATVALNGRTTVQGAVDTVYIAGADPGVDFRADGLSFYDNNARKYLTFDGVHSTSKLNLYYADSNTLGEHVFIADDEWYNVADGGAAQYYVGATAKMNHGIDFSGVSEALDVTLNTDYAADTTFWINNIHSIRGGAGSTKITGSDKNDTILAGTGETSIYGGVGHDKMFGNTSENKNAAEFFYTAGDGRDSISNFDFVTDAQDATADKVQFDGNISEVFLRGSDVMIKADGADGFLMLEGAQGKSFRVNDDLIAKVDKNVSFDGYTNSYVGIGEHATLTVGKGLGDVEVWLSDDSLEYHGTLYDGNFAVLDASQSDGRNILAGNELSNVITGGSGENNLWGGYSSENDTLIGGAGKNTFFYGAGNGRDVIRNTHDGDVISLEDITLEQITDANITAHGVALNFNDGGALFVDGTADVTYQLADGSTYTVDRTNREFR